VLDVEADQRGAAEPAGRQQQQRAIACAGETACRVRLIMRIPRRQPVLRRIPTLIDDKKVTTQQGRADGPPKATEFCTGTWGA
jgi:hypothetical protein